MHQLNRYTMFLIPWNLHSRLHSNESASTE
jgi:hypothetical protein